VQGNGGCDSEGGRDVRGDDGRTELWDVRIGDGKGAEEKGFWGCAKV